MTARRWHTTSLRPERLVTAARHQHRNCYCSVIGNDQFTYFATRERKSRLNFLEVLSGENPQYLINAAAIDYMRKRKLSKNH